MTEKRTVYLPKATFPLSTKGEVGQLFSLQEGYFFTPEELNEYTANVVRKALKTAAKKANMKCKKGHNGEFVEHWSINKQSITNTFDQTFKEFEVL